LWQEIGADDIVMIDEQGNKLAGRHEVEPTAMYIHAAIHRIAGKACVMHTHMPHATALTLTSARALDTTLSQNAMRFHGRIAIDAHYNGLALDDTEGERIASVMKNADIAFLGNHGVVVCGDSVAYAYDDLYYVERACMVEVLALRELRPRISGRKQPRGFDAGETCSSCAADSRRGSGAARLTLPGFGDSYTVLL
jgi:ribulose-5-phosphate 4-epimerase/fuculose-1-phosphate aldolase